jgi:CheY-like chemotaxis protein
MESVRVKLNTLEPDLIFPDIRVPKKKGLEIAKTIKKDPRLKKVLTLMLTSSSSSGAPHALKGASANICPRSVQEAELQLKWAGRNKDLSQAFQLYKVSKNEFK